MKPLKTQLLSTTVIPVLLAASVAIVTVPANTGVRTAQSIAANPCAAKSPCNPCAAKNPCNLCAAKRGCNPCAAKNPCNPCGAKNPCAAKNPCNPCAAKRGCNPCAAKNPCNPCGATNPCNPCGAGAAVKLTAAEASSVYNCLRGEMKTAYGKSGNKYAKAYAKWTVFSKQPYVSGTHGGRFVSNYANAAGKAYGKYEKSGRMPKGAVLAKDSFAVTAKGRAGLGPLFLIEKMGKGWHKAAGDWRYTLILPSGKVVGTTHGKGDKSVQFCIGCHITVAQDQDSMFFLPQ